MLDQYTRRCSLSLFFLRFLINLWYFLALGRDFALFLESFLHSKEIHWLIFLRKILYRMMSVWPQACNILLVFMERQGELKSDENTEYHMSGQFSARCSYKCTGWKSEEDKAYSPYYLDPLSLEMQQVGGFTPFFWWSSCSVLISFTSLYIAELSLSPEEWRILNLTSIKTGRTKTRIRLSDSEPAEGTTPLLILISLTSQRTDQTVKELKCQWLFFSLNIEPIIILTWLTISEIHSPSPLLLSSSISSKTSFRYTSWWLNIIDLNSVFILFAAFLTLDFILLSIKWRILIIWKDPVNFMAASGEFPIFTNFCLSSISQ